VGSPDIFSSPGEIPSRSINLITSHDGFSLNDLVSYQKKHNLNNGEDNRDGSNHNLSCNYGHEGPTTDPEIEALRQRQIKNFLCLLLLSHGTPMLVMGDEIRHSRQGNNNPWCQDNKLNWLDWDLVQENAHCFRFVKLLIALTKEVPQLRDDRFWFATSPDQKGDITWHGTRPMLPDWSPKSRCIAFTLETPGEGDQLLVLFNSSTEHKLFTLPELPPQFDWYQIIDTSLPAPADAHPSGKAPLIADGKVLLAQKSSTVLLGKRSTI